MINVHVCYKVTALHAVKVKSSDGVVTCQVFHAFLIWNITFKISAQLLAHSEAGRL